MEDALDASLQRRRDVRLRGTLFALDESFISRSSFSLSICLCLLPDSSALDVLTTLELLFLWVVVFMVECFASFEEVIDRQVPSTRGRFR